MNLCAPVVVQQYQDAIKAHKAGRNVDLSELPIPPGDCPPLSAPLLFLLLIVSPTFNPVCVRSLPGCPPLQGSEGGQENFMGVLEKAMQLANQDPDTVGDDDDEEEGQSEAAKVGGRVEELFLSFFRGAGNVSKLATAALWARLWTNHCSPAAPAATDTSVSCSAAFTRW